jgi:hypothetical protein
MSLDGVVVSLLRAAKKDTFSVTGGKILKDGGNQ